MCEFVTKLFVEGAYIQTKYAVLSFEFETNGCWFFNVRLIEFKVHGKMYRQDQPAKLMGFPKHRQEYDRASRETYDVECMPPPFYNRMRDRAIDDGKVLVQGDDSPAYEEREFYR